MQACSLSTSIRALFIAPNELICQMRSARRL
jgi:hypothetical protein